MDTVFKTNKELTYEEAELMFYMFLDNMKKYAEISKIYASILTDEYKKKWINDTLDKDINKIFLYYEENKLIGFIIAEESENEIFVRDFHIIESHQKDGHTFKNMIIEALKKVDVSKDFSGDIWMLNSHSREVFKHLGATFQDGKYRLSYEGLKKWL